MTSPSEPYLPGTVLLFRGHGPWWNSLLPRAIRLIIGNEITHVALCLQYLPQANIILVIESDVGGGKLYWTTPNTLKTKKGTKLVAVANLLHPINLDQNERYYLITKATSIANTKPFKKYSYLTIAKLAFSHLRGRLGLTPYHSIPFPRAYVCSTLVSYLFNSIRPLNPLFPCPNVVEPDDYTNPLLFTVTHV